MGLKFHYSFQPDLIHYWADMSLEHAWTPLGGALGEAWGRYILWQGGGLSQGLEAGSLWGQGGSRVLLTRWQPVDGNSLTLSRMRQRLCRLCLAVV